MQFYFFALNRKSNNIFFGRCHIFRITRRKQVSYLMQEELILSQDGTGCRVFLHVYRFRLLHIRLWEISLCLYEGRTGRVLFRQQNYFGSFVFGYFSLNLNLNCLPAADISIFKFRGKAMR